MSITHYENAFSESLCDLIYDIAQRTATTKGGTKVITPDEPNGEPILCWLNYSWEPGIVQDSTPVLCMNLPKHIVRKIDQELERLGVKQKDKHLSFEEQDWNGCMAYVWTYNSYIPVHNDGGKRAATLYLNREWDYSEGGHFNWYDEQSKEWKVIVPKFNSLVVNEGNVPHATTPVKSTRQFRISLQMFFLPRQG